MIDLLGAADVFQKGRIGRIEIGRLRLNYFGKHKAYNAEKIKISPNIQGG